MPPDRWERVQSVFLSLADLPPEEQAGLLDQECGDDEELRAEVQSLLASDCESAHAISAAIENEAALLGDVPNLAGERFGSWPAVSSAASLASDINPDERFVGTRLGPYQLEAIVGFGGMGAVYRASRVDDEFQQRVAIKLVRAAAESVNSQQRFRQERQILARLSHPNIARLLDGGSTPEGVPYLVMEFIEGVPITAWCDRHSLDIEARLRLFLKACEGVEAAHREHVVHRDIKPANIVVTSDGVPKLLDFGIARFLDPDAEGLAVTATRFQAMTPQYASPEQVRGEPASAVADVYSLGLVLYEILTGQKAQNISVHTPDTIAKVVCQVHPPAPAVLNARLAGDIDNIVRMAIRKEPENRYQTVTAFGEDIRRYLTGNPVVARPDTLRYRSSRFLRRNQVAVRAGLVSSACVAAALALTYWLGEPGRPPRTLQIVQLTQDSRIDIDDPIVTDGEKLYYTSATGGESSLAQVSVTGGASTSFPVPSLSNPVILDSPPDGSNLLISSRRANTGDASLWIVPRSGGPQRHVGDFAARFAALSRNGREIFYLGRTAIFRVNIDGSNRRKIADVPEGSYELRASPGPGPEVLRLSVFRSDMRSSGIWEVSADGSGLHPLTKVHGPGTGWPDALYSGNWIQSGRYYLMRSRFESVSSFWALRETHRFPWEAANQPVKIYGTPLETRSFTPSRDGKRVFFAAAQKRSEMVRFDSRRGQFLPFLPGVAGRYVSISKDQRQIAYTTASDDALWKSMADGTGRVRLTTSPNLRCFRPRWSPDGNLIVFTGSQPNKPSNIYVIPSGGGTPQVISPEPEGAGASWSPDGSSILLGRRGPSSYGLYIMDWKSRESKFLTGSENLAFGAWSPDGHHIVARRERADLELLDLETGLWSHLVAERGLAEPFWSHDSKYVYYQQSFVSEGQPIFRVRISDHRVEQMMSSKQIPQSDVSNYSLCALTQDDVPIAAIVRSNSEVYALEVDLP